MLGNVSVDKNGVQGLIGDKYQSTETETGIQKLARRKRVQKMEKSR
jgi:hypothetical protein